MLIHFVVVVVGKIVILEVSGLVIEIILKNIRSLM